MASIDDQEFIVNSILEMFKEADSVGVSFPFTATRQNAEIFFNLFIVPTLEHGGTILVAEAGGVPVGVTLVTIPRSDLEVKSRSATGHGTFVVREFRKMGVAKKLRTEVYSILKEVGIPYIDGVVDWDNRAGVISSLRHGFVPVAAVVRKYL